MVEKSRLESQCKDCLSLSTRSIDMGRDIEYYCDFQENVHSVDECIWQEYMEQTELSILMEMEKRIK